MSKGGSKIAIVVGLTLGLIYIVKLSDLGWENHQASQSAAQVEHQVSNLQAQVEALETAAVDAESDDYVDQWARENRNLSQPGDQPFNIVPEDEPAPQAKPQQGEQSSAWQRFVHWLRGDNADSASSPEEQGTTSPEAQPEDDDKPSVEDEASTAP